MLPKTSLPLPNWRSTSTASLWPTLAASINAELNEKSSFSLSSKMVSPLITRRYRPMYFMKATLSLAHAITCCIWSGDSVMKYVMWTEEQVTLMCLVRACRSVLGKKHLMRTESLLIVTWFQALFRSMWAFGPFSKSSTYGLKICCRLSFSWQTELDSRNFFASLECALKLSASSSDAYSSAIIFKSSQSKKS